MTKSRLDRPLRIAFFHNLPSGGGKRSAFEWVKRMSQKHIVDLYLYNPTVENFLDLRPHVNQTVLVGEGKTITSCFLRGFIARNVARRASLEIAKQINSGQYDLAFIMQCQETNSPYVLRHLRIPSLYFCHEPLAKSIEPHYRANYGKYAHLKFMHMKWRIKTDSTNARHATLICANSLYSRENIYRNYGVYPRLNYLGVDTTHFHPIDLKRTPVVLSVGSLAPLKAQDFIIKSVATLSERPAIRFIYNYSVSDYKSYLLHLAQELNVLVTFDCLPSQEELVIAYNVASITAFSSHLEPLGLVPLESFACATPVVGIAEGGVRETIRHGENGLLTERDPVEYGKAIETLLKDESLRARMGVFAREEVIKNWTWDRSYKKLEDHMHLTLGSNNDFFQYRM